MKKQIILVGNFASGKTTLAKKLCEKTDYSPYWEDPEERPFQKLFASNLERWSFANQIDFFTFKAEQEIAMRDEGAISIQDGSLDQDMFVFTQHLVNKGIMSMPEFNLCKEVYSLYRKTLGHPSLIIRVIVPISTLLDRRIQRSRADDDVLILSDELEAIEGLLDTWMNSIENIPVINFETENYSSADVDDLIQQIEAHFATLSG